MYMFVISWEEQRILVCAIELFIYICTSLPTSKQKTNPPFHPDTFPFWFIILTFCTLHQKHFLIPLCCWCCEKEHCFVADYLATAPLNQHRSSCETLHPSFAPHVFFFWKHLPIVSWARRQSGSTHWIHLFCSRETRETTYSYLSKQNI